MGWGAEAPSNGAGPGQRGCGCGRALGRGARAGRAAGVGACLAQGAQHGAQLGHGLAASLYHGVEDLTALVTGGQGLAYGAGLDDQEADVMGDHIVQLPGYAHPFFGHGPSGVVVALAVGLLGPVLGGGQQGALGADNQGTGHGGHQEHEVGQWGHQGCSR